MARVLALRRRRLPGFQIARAAKVSEASVSRCLRRHAARLAVVLPPPICRYERAQPGELIHFDIKKLARIERPGPRVTGDRQRDHTRGAGWEYLHIAIDDHSRLAFAQLLPGETARSAIAFLHAALAFFARHGIPAQRVYSDNGSCYRARAMAAAVQALGLKHRFHQALPAKDLRQGRALHPNLAPRVGLRSRLRPRLPTRRLHAFLHNYNWHRPPHALKLLAPVSRLPLP